MSDKKPLFPRDLSSFLQQAASSLDEIKDTVVKGGQVGKAALDVQLLKRDRERLLVQLGEALLAEVARGASLPASCDVIVGQIRELDDKIVIARRDADAAWKGTAGSAPSARHDDLEDDDDA